MSTMIVLFAILGWFAFSIAKYLEAKGKASDAFSPLRYLSDQAGNLILGLVLVIVVLYSAPATFDTLLAAFTLGASSQALVRSFLKKKTWNGLGLFK